MDIGIRGDHCHKCYGNVQYFGFSENVSQCTGCRRSHYRQGYKPCVAHRPHVEEDRLGGPDPYSASKGAAELLISSYADSFFADTNVSVVSSERGISSAVVTGLKHALFQTLYGHGLQESLCSCDDRTQFAPGNTF